MSGTKSCNTSLDEDHQAQIERERRLRAELERQQREAEAEKQRLAELQKALDRLKQDWQSALDEIKADGDALLPEDREHLTQQAQELPAKLGQVKTLEQLPSHRQTFDTWKQDWQKAQARKRRFDAEQARQAEREKQQFELNELRRRLTELGEADAQKFAPDQFTQTETALSEVATAWETEADTITEALQSATALVDDLVNQVVTARTEWQKQQAQAQIALTELQGLYQGMQADSTLQRWQPQALSQVSDYVKQAETAMEEERFTAVADYLSQAQAIEQEAVTKANEAQLKADKRDYITDCMAQQLEAMGFRIVHRQPEYPNRPASATILSGETPAGKRVSASIPTEGEVLYDVDGYEKRTVATVQGGMAKTCEDAHQMLLEFHQGLAEIYGVKMGEVQWKGKVPLDQLAERQQLPRSDTQDRSNYR